MATTLKPCLEELPGGRLCNVLSSRSRCPTHTTGRERARGTRQARGYTTAWMTLVATAIKEHVYRHGWICPGYQRPPHRVAPGELTGDHTLPLSQGGTSTADNLGILCGFCNTSKGGSNRETQRAGRPRPDPPAAQARSGPPTSTTHHTTTFIA